MSSGFNFAETLDHAARSRGDHPALIHDGTTLSHAEFEALIEGLDLVVTKRRKRWHPKVSAA